MASTPFFYTRELSDFKPLNEQIEPLNTQAKKKKAKPAKVQNRRHQSSQLLQHKQIKIKKTSTKLLFFLYVKTNYITLKIKTFR